MHELKGEPAVEHVRWIAQQTCDGWAAVADHTLVVHRQNDIERVFEEGAKALCTPAQALGSAAVCRQVARAAQVLHDERGQRRQRRDEQGEDGLMVERRSRRQARDGSYRAA
jgi:hypothetical protein